MNRREEALAIFEEGYNCSQAVFAAFAPSLGLDEDLAYKLACGFGGGMGRTQKTCGALTGGILALGLGFGRSKGEGVEGRDRTYALTRALIAEFEGRHGSSDCLTLLGCDMTSEEGKKRIKDEGLHDRVCARCVSDAVELVEASLAQP